jgi:hypothetical protein
MHQFRPSLVAFLALTAGCGGGGGGGGGDPLPPPPPPPPPPDASAGGIWEGLASTGVAILGLVTETGEFHFIQNDGVQYVGTAGTSQNELSADFIGIAPFGKAFGDGSTTGTGTLTGTVQERSTLSGDSSFTTALGATVESTITLTYNELYERDSSLATIAGNYLNPDTNAVINVNSNGVVFSQDPVTECIINGTISIIDPAFNAYRVQYEFSNCMGQSAILNGTVADGLGTLDNTVSPEEVIIGVVNADAGYAFTGAFPRT